MKTTPQHFESDFFPGWDVTKRTMPDEHLKWRAAFLAEKKTLIARARWWRHPDLRRRRIVVVT